jgi:AraC-like DNA-binding protein
MLVLFLSFLGILLSLVIIRFNPNNRYLAAFYFLNSLYGAFAAAVFYYKIPFISVILLVHFSPLFLLMGPCIYFYIRYELTKSNQIKASDLLHFLPFFLSVLAIFPYSLQSLEYKYRFVALFHVSNYVAIDQLNLLIIPVKYLFIAKNIILSIYMLYISAWYVLTNQRGILILNKGKSKWLDFLIPSILFSNLLILSFIVYRINNLSNGDLVNPYPVLIVSSVVGTLLYISVLFFPNVLYGEVKKQIDPPVVQRPSGGQLQELEQLLQVYLINHPYISLDFGKPKLMSDLKISDRLFAYYFNEYLGISFTQWKSDLRIDYANNLVKNGYLKNHTIESLARLVGFQSRSKFSTAFKSRIGSLPSNVSN